MATAKSRFNRVSELLDDSRAAEELAVDALTLALIADGCEVAELTAEQAQTQLDTLLQKAGK